MNRQDAERITTEYLNPVYGFALKRCRSLQDAEDLSSDIILKVYRTLLVRDDIEDTGKFIWTIAHNMLSNYYRDNQQNFLGISTEEITEQLCESESDLSDDLVTRETTEKLQREIAYLSKVQRRIVIAYYYENKKQNEIAEELGIPVGTVKWHLFVAKKDLKKGMETMRTASELKFNPVRFARCETIGSVGSKGTNETFFRSALSQNIVYAVWKEAKTVNQIADALGVSPVYVESEAEYLEEYGFLTKHGDRYLCNILIDEPTSERNRLQDEMYEKAAKIFANELYDELMNADIWENPNLTGGYTGEISFTYDPPKDRNFFLWALIPYIIVCSGDTLTDAVSFEEAAAIRPDGAQNFCQATICDSGVTLPKYSDPLNKWEGPCWSSLGKYTVWQMDSEWSEKRIDDMYPFQAQRDLAVLGHLDDELSEEDIAWLSERGYFKYKFEMTGPSKGCSKLVCQCIWIGDGELKNTLIAIGNRIREEHKSEFEVLQKAYTAAVLCETPPHVRKMRKYLLQFLLRSDKWFLLHCMKELVNNGKLKPPTEEQKKSLSTIIIRE